LNKKIIIGLIGVLLLLLGYALIPKLVFASPDDTTLYPTDDCFIWGANPDTNYDEHANELSIFLSSGDDQQEVIIKFDLSSIPAGATITGAKLRLYKFADRSGYAHSYVQLCKAVDDNWAEETVTWNLAPAEDGDLAQADTDESLGWKEWEHANLLAFIQTEFADDKVVSFRLNRDSFALSEYVQYHDREDGTYPPKLYIEYTAVSDNEPFYSDVGYDGKTQVGLYADFWCYWEDDFELDICYIEHNSTGTSTNYSISVSGISSWANKTFQLNFTASIRIEYKWFCSDNASQWNQTSTCFLVTTPLYITFNLNNSTMGKFYVDLIYTENETQNSYNYDQNISLTGIPFSSNYTWNNFTWTGGSITTNNYDYSTSGNNTVWCNFDLAGVGGIDENYFVLGFVITGCAILFIVIVIKDKNKGDE